MVINYNTSLSGGTNGTTITLPLNGAVNVNVDWGDGSSDTYTTAGNRDHTYSAGGAYTVTITGSLEHFGATTPEGYDNTQQLVSVTSWTGLGLTDLSYAFAGKYPEESGTGVDSYHLFAIHLEQVPTSIPASVTNTSYMFCGAARFNQDISSWDVSNITNMSHMFYGAEDFNQEIGNWDVSNVTDMSGMFRADRDNYTYSFSKNINNWNVSSVTDMSYMFSGHHGSTQSIENWNVANVTNMYHMFYNNYTFNSDISNWNVSNVTNMNAMFMQATSFNQAIGNWNVSNVTNMNAMFMQATSFNQAIGNWNVANLTNMDSLFLASGFNQTIGNWNVGSVTSMQSMFGVRYSGNSNPFNQDISNWNVSNVTNMFGMFNGAKTFNQNISNWDVGNVTNMRAMFNQSEVFNQDIGNWNVSNVIDMSGMFAGATAFDQDIGSWDVSNVTKMTSMFWEAEAFNQDISNWDVGNVTSMEDMFAGTTSFDQNIGSWNMSNVTNISGIFWSIFFLSPATLSVSNYDAILVGWSAQVLRPNLWLNAEECKYSCTIGADARAILTSSPNNWTIYDAGVDDNTSPVTPTLTDINSQCPVTLTAPTTTDNCAGTVTGTTTTNFPVTAIGTTVIAWNFDDGNGNNIQVNQNVIISNDNTSPIIPTISDLSSECDVTPTAPTTTDNCAGTITGTTASIFPITATGTTVVIWNFDDGNGNNVNANQNVIISGNDTTDPEIITLPDLKSACSITATAPTTTDNCAGTVTGTTSNPTQYTEQGTHIITWNFADDNGNSINVNQNVIIDDNTNPETPNLADLTDECSITATVPTTNDNCSGTITATTSDPTEYAEQGTYVITWNFADENGNSINVEQNVIIGDNTSPTINCIDNHTKQLSENQTVYKVSSNEFDPVLTNDNCGIASITNNFNNLATLENAEIPTGLTTIIWTIKDNADNTTTCSFDIQVNSFVNIEILKKAGISIYPNPTNGKINL